MNRNTLIIIGVLVILGIGAILLLNSNGLLSQSSEEESSKNEMSGAPQVDESAKETDAETANEMKDLLYQLAGNLDDVTKGEDIRDINTSGKAAGIAKSNWDGSQYLVFASFENLPEPQGEDFYEGWVVQREPFMFISTGVVDKIDGKYMNAYRSDQDLTSYDFYVLTIEPNDGDPAPADHILEGEMN